MSLVSTGAKLQLTIAGVVVAYSNNCNYQLNYNMAPVEVLGQVTVNEYAELGVTVEFSASMFRVVDQAAVSLGIAPKISAFLTQPELVMTILDKVQNTVIVNMNGIKCTGRSGAVDARGVFTETLGFVGRVFYDEAGQ